MIFFWDSKFKCDDCWGYRGWNRDYDIRYMKTIYEVIE